MSTCPAGGWRVCRETCAVSLEVAGIALRLAQALTVSGPGKSVALTTSMSREPSASRPGVGLGLPVVQVNNSWTSLATAVVLALALMVNAYI